MLTSDQKQSFLTYTAQQGKSYKTTAEFNMRAALFIETDNNIKTWNAQ
jgi:hypothetical protein